LQHPIKNPNSIPTIAINPVSVKVTSILYIIILLYIMPDTEEKPKRQMTPEARERMLSNLAKGRAAKSRKLAEAKKSKLNVVNSTHPEPQRENDETDDTLGGENTSSLASMKLTCHGCKKVFKHSSSKSKHVKICKVLNAPAPAPEPQHTPSPILKPEIERKPRARRKQKVTIIESDSESSSSSSEEEELVVHRKRKKKKNVVVRDAAPPPPPPPPPPLIRQPPKPVAPQLSPQEIAARREQAMILHMARSMGSGGLQ